MKSIPLDTEVLCTDGRAGKSTCVKGMSSYPRPR